MLPIGFMTLSKTSEMSYLTEIAKRASQFDIKCYRFIPSSINPISEKADGEVYQPASESWESCQFDIPPILYDRCFYTKSVFSTHNSSIVNWLKTREDLTFLGYGLPNKLELYEHLQNTELHAYLPVTKELKRPESFLKNLQDGVPVMLKPANGSQGRGIFKVTKEKDSIQIVTDKQEQQISKSFPIQKASLWLKSLTEENRYLYQSYLKLVNQYNEPFDLRVLMQKTKTGEWHQAGNGIRTGRLNGIISNMSAGGIVSKTEDWLNTFPRKQRTFLAEELTYLLTTIPALLEKHFPPLFELGIDIGIDTNGAIWVLDLNSKPGRKTVLALYPEKSEAIYQAPLFYAKYLADKSRQPEEETR